MSRTVHIITRMNVGGPAALLVQLLRGLPEQELLTGEVQDGEADFLTLREPDVPHTRVPGLGRSPRPGDDLRALNFLTGELRRRKPAVVHTHTAKAGVLGRVAARLAGVPHVAHTFHGHLLHGYFSPAVTRAVILTERVLARRTDRLVAVGDQVREDLLHAGIGRPSQYAVIPPGISVPSLQDRQRARNSLGLPPERPVVAWAGRFIGIKRPDRMLEVARRLPEATFLVAGDGPLLERTRAAAPGNVRFLGWCSDVQRVFAAADLALLTSDNEGMPVTLVEAAMSGTPAVSTDVGSAREVVVGEVTPPDPDALAAAARRVLKRDLGATARAHAVQRFSPEQMLRAHADLYASLTDGRRPGGAPGST